MNGTRLTRSDVVRELQYARYNGIAANFRGANLEGVDMSAMFTEDENLSGFINVDFTNANLRNANMSHNLFKHVDFRGADLHGVIANNVRISSHVVFDQHERTIVGVPL